ncbi:MAG: hypothetical protein M3Y35_07630, partial [Actinomycetota bacterium]|nr:hypothetical protein [Actinomycetota bacterium]
MAGAQLIEVDLLGLGADVQVDEVFDAATGLGAGVIRCHGGADLFGDLVSDWEQPIGGRSHDCY